MTLKNKLTTLLASLNAFLVCLPAKVFATDLKGGYDYNAVLNLTGVNTTENRDGAMNNMNNVLLDILGFVRGAGIVICVIMLVWCAIQLASSAGNNQKRQIAMEGIKNVLIAVAIVGGATLICSLAYGLLS